MRAADLLPQRHFVSGGATRPVRARFPQDVQAGEVLGNLFGLKAVNSNPGVPVTEKPARTPAAWLSGVVRAAVVMACLAYVLQGIDFGKTADILAGYDFLPVSLVPVYLLLTLVPTSIRLRFIAANRLKMRSAYAAVLLGLGLNVILPARLGEVAKVLFVSGRARFSIARGFNVVFWERFFDLQAVLCMAIALAAVYRREVLVLPVLAVVAGIWTLLIVQRRWPGAVQWLVGLLPITRVRRLALDFLLCVDESSGARFLSVLGLLTVLTWVSYPGAYFLVLKGAAGMGLSVGQVLLVFLVASLGAAIPSSPGALGVYEASIVLGLSWCGVEKEQALAAAVALRCLLFLPLALAGVAVVVGSRLDLGALRQVWREGGRPPSETES